jgi:hypothetical protein
VFGNQTNFEDAILDDLKLVKRLLELTDQMDLAELEIHLLGPGGVAEQIKRDISLIKQGRIDPS